jgi:hypothetical protein
MTHIKGPAGGIVPLQQQEAEKVKQDQTEKAKQKDLHRIAQGAGFQKAGHKRAPGDISQTPIPLPDDELVERDLDHQAMGNAEENFSLADSNIEQAEETMQQGGTSFGAALLKSSLTPTEACNAKLSAISEHQEEPPELKDIQDKIASYFSVPIPNDAPIGLKLLAVGLIVSGQAHAVEASGEKLEGPSLREGIRQTIARGGGAFREAQKRGEGIQVQRGFLQTSVPKRMK